MPSSRYRHQHAFPIYLPAMSRYRDCRDSLKVPRLSSTLTHMLRSQPLCAATQPVVHEN